MSCTFGESITIIVIIIIIIIFFFFIIIIIGVTCNDNVVTSCMCVHIERYAVSVDQFLVQFQYAHTHKHSTAPNPFWLLVIGDVEVFNLSVNRRNMERPESVSCSVV